MHYVPLEEIGIMRDLRTLGLSAVKDYGSIDRAHFSQLAPSLEELDLSGSDVRELGRGAFAHVPSVSALDLSDNRVSRVDDDAFREVGASLRHLRASNALYFRRLPNAAFRTLTALRTLDLSNNHVSQVPIDTFHKMGELRNLYLQVGKERAMCLAVYYYSQTRLIGSRKIFSLIGNFHYPNKVT